MEGVVVTGVLGTSFWGGKRVLVTGATGIVGSWLVGALLDSAAHVVALVRDDDPQSELFRSGRVLNLSIVSGCLEHEETVERAVNEHEVDSVFHLGAQTIVSTAQRSPAPTFESNIRGTWNVLEACRRLDGLVQRVVVASSDKAYGPQTSLPYTEDTPLAGVHPYEVSKSCADLIAQSYHRAYGLPVGIARCGNIYGGGDLNWSRIVPGTIRSLLNSSRPIIRSDGTCLRDYLFVDDAVSAYLTLGAALADRSIHGHAFNFSAESPLTVMEIYREICAVVGQDVTPSVLGTASGEIQHQYLSSEKARSLLGWKPRFSLQEGLMATVAWYREFFSAEGKT
ncbi:MAG: NAD-dependent epimerase/dehydratase family protein [Actinomycetota bacterium]